MTLKDFIVENREGLDEALKSWGSPYFNDDARRDVVMNDEGWYNFARSSGVRV